MADAWGNASNDRDIATFFKDLEEKGRFYGFPVRRGDTSNSNFNPLTSEVSARDD